MTKPRNGRRLLTSTVRLATLVCVGVAETACNLQVSRFEPADAGHDAGRDAAPAEDGATTDAGVLVDAAMDVDAGETTDAGPDANADVGP